MLGQNKLQLKLEVVWWVVTALIVIGVLYPIYKAQPNYPFWVENTAFIIVFITFTRYIFLLKHTFLAYQQWVKVVVAVLCIPLFMYLMTEFNTFRVIAEEIGIEEMFNHLSLKGQTDRSSYVRTEMLFFGAASIICSIFMPFRMLISFWRTYNRGTV